MKSRIRIHLCVVCMLLLVVAGCKVKRPSDVIPETEMENLLYDYHLAKSMGDNLSHTENYKKTLYLDAIFKKHGTTEAIFDSSLVWYARNTETFSKICERVKKRLRAQQEEINALIALRDKKPKMTQSGDSIDVWAWARMLRLTGGITNSQYTFVLPVDTNYKERDTLVWEARYHFLEPRCPDSLRYAAMAMQIIYEKDTVSSWELVGTAGTHMVRLYADTLGAMKEVRGFIYYPNNGKQKAGALLADRFKLMRYHCTDSLSPAERDSVNRQILIADSLRRISMKEDSLQRVQAESEESRSRQDPDEMNRRRTNAHREKKPEQIEVEQHIQQEKLEQRKKRQMNQQRKQQQKRRQTQR